MANNAKILAFAGSLRGGSFNKKLLEHAVNGARGAGATVNVIDLKEYPLPVYDGDIEAEHGLPDNARRLKDMFYQHNGLLIASPEYNGSVTAAFKNMIDWVSRQAEGESSLACFRGKVGALVATGGRLGGVRGLAHARQILSGISVLVLPDQVAIPVGAQAFNEDGTLKDETQQKSVEALGATLTQTLNKLFG